MGADREKCRPPASPVQTLGWGQLKDSVSEIARGHSVNVLESPVLRNLSRTTAALLALLLGGLGVHRFYLGRPVSGILFLLFCWTLVPVLIAFVQSIILFSITDAEFTDQYCRR